jgi:DNA-binding MarR family transcriptional regulator
MMPTRADPAAARSLDFDNYVPGLIAWLANKLCASASKLYRERYGLGIIDWRVLASIAAEETCNAARICQLVGLDKAAVSRSLVLLSTRGLLEFEGHGGRVKPVRLTPAGRALHDTILEVALAREARLLGSLKPAEIAELVRMLHILLDTVPGINEFVDAAT